MTWGENRSVSSFQRQRALTVCLQGAAEQTQLCCGSPFLISNPLWKHCLPGSCQPCPGEEPRWEVTGLWQRCSPPSAVTPNKTEQHLKTNISFICSVIQQLLRNTKTTTPAFKKIWMWGKKSYFSLQEFNMQAIVWKKSWLGGSSVS